MFGVRIHGRGGQGVVTAAELLSVAAFDDGFSAQAFPTFGSERMGAPVTSFCRINRQPIRLREPIAEPDCVIVQDPTLLHQVDVFGGLRPSGVALVNSKRTPDELGLGDLTQKVLTVPATDLAREHLGRPLPNAALLGAFAALTGVVTLTSLTDAICARFPGEAGRGNARAAQAAFAHVAHAPEPVGA
jgi:pyruvate ferredoxin oxidoreductase gamma subunit